MLEHTSVHYLNRCMQLYMWDNQSTEFITDTAGVGIATTSCNIVPSCSKSRSKVKAILTTNKHYIGPSSKAELGWTDNSSAKNLYYPQSRGKQEYCVFHGSLIKQQLVIFFWIIDWTKKGIMWQELILAHI